MPLWTSYLVKILAWRLILSDGGVLNWLLKPLHLSGPGFGEVAVYLVLSYIWLPYMILPLAAGFERVPTSLLEASTDLGARTWADVPLGGRCRWCSRRWWRGRSSPSR